MKGVVDMLLLHKIFISQMFQEYTEIPFYGRYPKIAWKDGRFKIVLADSETWQETVLEFSDFQALVSKMDELHPYGYVVRTHDRALSYYHLIAVPKVAYRLTDYVDSVKFMAKDDCYESYGVQFVGKSNIYVTEKLDDCGSLFACTLTGGGNAQSMGLTLYDMLCIFPYWHSSDGYYIETFKDNGGRGFYDFSYVYKVTCSDVAKVEAIIAKSKVYRPNLFSDYMNLAKQWG